MTPQGPGTGPPAGIGSVVVPVSAASPDERAPLLAGRIAVAVGRPLRLVHVSRGGEPPRPAALLERLAGQGVRAGWEVVAGDDVASGVLSAAEPGSLLVMSTEQANRWSGKASISEHILDLWDGLAVLVGPAVTSAVLAPGPLVVGVDGSPGSLRATGPAAALAAVLGRRLVLARVVGEDDAVAAGRIEVELEHLARDQGREAEARVVVSNDPVTALAGLAEDLDAALVVLSSRGDRRSRRATISRTCTGVAAESARPLLVVGRAVTAGP
jgi:nucleotide-binding universal stress UspA family protein